MKPVESCARCVRFELRWLLRTSLCAVISSCIPPGTAASPNGAERPPPTECDGITVKLAPNQDMIGDFESGAPDPWYGWDDGSAKTTLEVQPSGASGSHFAAHVRGGPYMAWGGAMTRLLRCMDVSGFDGLELWMKAEHHSRVRIQFQMPKTTGISHRDDCKSGCAPPGVEVEPGSEWRKYAIPFDSFRAPKGEKLGRVITSIDIEAPRLMDLWVDQIRFYKGAPAKDAAVL